MRPLMRTTAHGAHGTFSLYNPTHKLRPRYSKCAVVCRVPWSCEVGLTTGIVVTLWSPHRKPAAGPSAALWKIRLPHVRFTPKIGHWNSVAQCPLCAKSGHSALR